MSIEAWMAVTEMIAIPVVFAYILVATFGSNKR